MVGVVDGDGRSDGVTRVLASSFVATTNVLTHPAARPQTAGRFAPRASQYIVQSSHLSHAGRKRFNKPVRNEAANSSAQRKQENKQQSVQKEVFRKEEMASLYDFDPSQFSHHPMTDSDTATANEATVAATANPSDASANVEASNGENNNEGDSTAGLVRSDHTSADTAALPSSFAAITALLDASQQLASNHGLWAGEENGGGDPGKRKRDDSPSHGDNPSKVRKTTSTISTFVNSEGNTGEGGLNPLPLPLMTTVTCLHAAVAQKSYGNEKRFLCPPPVVRIDTPPTRAADYRAQQLVMRIYPEVNETLGPPAEQKANLDDTMSACFKYLHVGGTSKSKSFHLSMDIAEPPQFDPVQPPEGAQPGDVTTARIVKPASTWASFNSAPVTIISKPSKKTAKTRNLASCILAGGPVSLFNRINSQTVRTKYMTVDQGRLCASNTTWSAFNVEVVQAVTDPNAQPPDIAGYHPGAAPPQPVTYGSTLLLTDSHTGLTSDPLVIRKVDKGRIVMDEGTMGGPVSQMQKVALCRITETGARYYLSAAGPLQILPDPNAPAGSDGKNHVIATHPLVYQPPAVREEMKNDVRVEVDEVDDFLCWTIVGISKFQYTFFDGIHNTAIPRFPITPFPTLLSPPIYKPQTHTLDLTIANYFYTDPTNYPNMPPPQPLEVWLGTLGPLQARVYQNGELSHTIGAASIVAHGAAGRPPMPPYGSTIVVVEMPPMREMLRMVEILTGLDLGLNQVEDSSKGKEKEAAPPAAPAYPYGAFPAITRGIPILFVRTADGVGYHSGREIACENVLGAMAGIAGAPTGNIDSWAVRVL